MIEKIEYNSTIRCPECGFEKSEIMPADSCQFFYECSNCGKILKPETGDCCVFCSYGSVKCPPVQETGKCNC
jgi:rubredoxin